MPKVSICIPAYNQTTYLQKCLQSVLEQDFTDYELIISDDTQENSVKDFVYSFLKDAKFRYYQNHPSLGTPQNWNSAISKATGKYIKLLHHDDFFTQKNSLRLMVEEIEKNNADFLCCATKVWFTTTGNAHIHRINATQLSRLKKDIFFLFFKNCFGSPSATLYKNSTLQYNPKLKWLVDLDFYMQYIQQHKKFSYLNMPLVCTAHEIQNQVTGTVINDKVIQIKEHVLVFNRLSTYISSYNNYQSFFEYLFIDYNVNSFDELVSIVPEAESKKEFYESVLKNRRKNLAWKTFKRRLYGSRYNKYTLKLEQF